MVRPMATDWIHRDKLSNSLPRPGARAIHERSAREAGARKDEKVGIRAGVGATGCVE